MIALNTHSFLIVVFALSQKILSCLKVFMVMAILLFISAVLLTVSVNNDPKYIARLSRGTLVPSRYLNVDVFLFVVTFCS